MADLTKPVGPPRFEGGKWGPILKAVVDGSTVYVPGERLEIVVGSLKRPWLTRQGYRIRSRTHRNGGSVVWMEKR